MITAVVLAAVALAALCLLLRGRDRLRHVPGPKGWPFFGNALDLDTKSAHEILRKWAKQYGDIMRIKLFGKDVIVVNSVQGITDVTLTKTDDFAGRPFFYRKTPLLQDEDINLSSLTPKVAHMKQIAMTCLKQVGNKLLELEEIITGVTDTFLEKMDDHVEKKKEVDLRLDIHSYIAHITYILAFGRGLSEKEHQDMIETDQRVLQVLSPSAENILLDHIPLLRGPWYGKYREMMKVFKRANQFYWKQVEISMARQSESKSSQCVVDGLVKERQRALEAGEDGVISMRNIDAVGKDISIGGTTTTTSAVTYFIMLMAANQDIQSEAHAEVVKVLGDRFPTLKDRFDLPYVEGMVFELLRLMSQVPVSTPHATARDTTLLGYEIPAGIEIWPNLWYVHHDEKLWEDPWKFKHRRFLDDEGKLLLADHPLRRQFLAFGAGKRVCGGEMVARNRMFLVLTILLQKYKFLPPRGETLNTDPRNFYPSFVLEPPVFKVTVERW